jgi:UDP-3-O-[3-hydroxymyristoyl] glucosamine N-acyltransferase
MFPFQELTNLLQPLQTIGVPPQEFDTVIPFDEFNTNPHHLMWINKAGNGKLSQVPAGIIICEWDENLPLQSASCLLVVPAARNAFFKVMKHFFSASPKKGVHPTALVHQSITIPETTYIGAYSIIEEGCIIGQYVQINHHTVLLSGTVVKNNVHIGSHCTIGDDGFGYEKNDNGNYELVNHIGKVVIGNHVEIGNSVCIDKGTLGDTIIGDYSKIDNQVHIAHNVQIGKNVLVIAHAMVAGSCIIEDDVWIAPCAAVLQKTRVKKGAMVGMGAVVFNTVSEGETVIGNPARVTKTTMQMQ